MDSENSPAGGGEMASDNKAMKSRVEPGMEIDLAGRRTYGEYLKLDRLLGAQQPVSKEHDELAFIVIHHVQELWLKLVAYEIEAAMAAIRADHLPPAFKSLARVTRIQEQLIAAWDVLSTMTPADYLAFRSALGPASGFQSYQYRLVEFRLGAKDPEMLLPHRHDPGTYAKLNAALTEPSLYDEALRLLARRGHPVPKEVLDRDFSQPYHSNPQVRDVWLSIYRQAQEHFDLYELAEELVDVEDWFQQWRFRHMKTVERIIGHKPGTGGSSGVGYLKTALERSFFPELWEVRTYL
jgi:tryptophan 2,3-dioxygenase